MWQRQDSAAAAKASALALLMMISCAAMLGTCTAAGLSSQRRQLRQATSNVNVNNLCPYDITVIVSFPLDDGGFGGDSNTFGCDYVTQGLNPDSALSNEGECIRSFSLSSTSSINVDFAKNAALYMLPSDGAPAVDEGSYTARADGEGCAPDDDCFTWYILREADGSIIDIVCDTGGSEGDWLAPLGQPGPDPGNTPTTPSTPSTTPSTPSGTSAPSTPSSTPSRPSGTSAPSTPSFGSTTTPSSGGSSNPSGTTVDSYDDGGGSSVPLGAIIGASVGGAVLLAGLLFAGIRYNKIRKARASPKADPFDADLDVDKPMPAAPRDWDEKKSLKPTVAGGAPPGNGAIAAAGTSGAVSFTVDGVPAGNDGAAAVALV